MRREACRTLAADRHPPLGPVVCIAPWNFPLAIFTGQVAAALAAGNPVLAKPAEETPLIAAEAVRLLHGPACRPTCSSSCPGAGEVGRRWSPTPASMGVMFTGSTEVARLIQRQLAERLRRRSTRPADRRDRRAERAVVDCSALAEQVVADVIASAFDRPASAARRCASSACRRTSPTVRSPC